MCQRGIGVDDRGIDKLCNPRRVPIAATANTDKFTSGCGYDHVVSMFQTKIRTVRVRQEEVDTITISIYRPMHSHTPYRV